MKWKWTARKRLSQSRHHYKQNRESPDLWGDTVNTASRMESHGVANRIQCTRAVVETLADGYVFEARGEIEVKGKGLVHTYFLVGSRDREARSA